MGNNYTCNLTCAGRLRKGNTEGRQGESGGPRPLDVAVGARVGHGRRRLRGEQHQDLLVLARERLAVLLVAEKEVAEMLAPIAHRESGLNHDPPAKCLASHRESTALGVGQAKRSRTKVLPEDAILLPEIVDAICVVASHPASQGQPEEVQRVGHGLRLHGSDTASCALEFSWTLDCERVLAGGVSR